MWNLGADVIVHDGHSLNVNARGWHSMKIVAPFTAVNPWAYEDLGGSVYLDASYQLKNVLSRVDLRVTATNLFDNTDPVGMVINNGVFHPRGRNIAFQLSTRF
jgi:hypothetical protein